MTHLNRQVFLTLQGLGAGNDNLVKQAILVMIGFGLVDYVGDPSLWTNVASGLFIIPFLLLSGVAGRWVAVTDLRRVIITIKNLEVLCALMAAAGLVLGNLTLLLVSLAGLGAQSTLFGPSKFSWPARTESIEALPSVTGSIEAITFMAILLGSLIGGLMVSIPVALAGLIVSLALIGRWLAGRLPSVPAASTELASYHDHPQAIKARRLISWFWFLGASYLTQLPLLTREIMQWPAESVSYALAAFAIGVGVGSKATRHIGATSLPAGYIGLIVLGLILPFCAQLSGWTGLLALAGLGVAGGLYVVPLYVWMQQHLPVSDLPQAIGRNNRLNAILMIASAGFAIVTLVQLGLTPEQYFVTLALCSALIAPWVKGFATGYSGS